MKGRAGNNCQPVAYLFPMERSSVINVKDYFEVDLVNLADVGLTDYNGIYAPKESWSREKVGVTKAFLEDAAAYHEMYFNSQYIKGNLKQAFDSVCFSKKNPVILDIGSGSGNTVIAALDLLEEANVIATDISENLLQILKNHVPSESKSRVSYVCMDATQNHYKEESFDLVLSNAILHHLLDPFSCVKAASSALKKGGHAIFFEPFEIGHAVLRIALKDIMVKASIRGALEPLDADLANFDEEYYLKHNADVAKAVSEGQLASGMQHWLAHGRMENREFRNRDDAIGRTVRAVLTSQIDDLTFRITTPKNSDEWRKIDDKWLFSKSYFEKMADDLDLDCSISRLHPSDHPFMNQMSWLLHVACKGTLPSDAWNIIESYDKSFSQDIKNDIPYAPLNGTIPAWAWDIIESYDKSFSPDFKNELLFEGCIIFTKR